MSAQAASGATCAANETDGVFACERCGLQWRDGERKPDCDPITFKTLIERMLDETTSAESSLRIVGELQAEGTPASAARARRRLAELNAVLRLVERCAGDARLRALLNGKEAN